MILNFQLNKGGSALDKEKILLGIVENIDNFPQTDKDDVIELIEHCEWGVAFEIICSVIEQERLMIERNYYEKIVQLGKEMQLDSCFWEDIKELVH